MAILQRYTSCEWCNFNGANETDSFSFQTKITGKTAANNNDDNIAGRVDVEIMVPLK